MSLAFARAFRAYLLGNPSVANALPGGIHPDMIPQEAQFPAAAYTVSSTPISSITGLLPVSSVEMILHLRANNPTQIETLTAAIRSAVVEVSGRISEQNVIIAGLRITSNSSDVESLNDGDDEPYHIGEINITGFVKEQ
jgi:hypothetical protein